MEEGRIDPPPYSVRYDLQKIPGAHDGGQNEVRYKFSYPLKK